MGRAMLNVVAAVLVLMVVNADALTCVFFHGIGQPGPGTATKNKVTDPNYARSNLKSYWGDMDVRAAAAGCTKTVFYWTDTISRGWNNAALQAEYCDMIAQVNADVIFTHSMGNMIIGGAVLAKNAHCANIGPAANQVHWYGLQGPMKGSPAADVAGSLCKNIIIAKFFSKECVKGSLSAAYSSLKPSTCANSGLTAVAGRLMRGNMCGVMPSNVKMKTDIKGFVASKVAIIQKDIDDAGLAAIKGLVNDLTKKQYADWNANNAASPSVVPATGADGMVGFDSCRVTALSNYKKDPTHPYYVLDGNHADGRCSFGQDASSPATQQCSYMQNMIKASIAVKHGVVTGPALAALHTSAPVPAKGKVKPVSHVKPQHAPLHPATHPAPKRVPPKPAVHRAPKH